PSAAAVTPATMTSLPPFQGDIVSPAPFEWDADEVPTTGDAPEAPSNRDSIFPPPGGVNPTEHFPSFSDFSHLKPPPPAELGEDPNDEPAERRISVDTRTLGTQLRPSAPPPGRWAQERESYRPEGRYPRASLPPPGQEPDLAV